MIEVINGYLLAYFFILCTLSALVPILVKPIIACFSRPSNKERSFWSEMIKLKEEQKKYSIKEEFAAYSKLQRKINKLEFQLKEDTQSRMSKSFAVKGSVKIIFHVVYALVILISVIWFRREPIVTLKGNLFPLTSMLQYPCEMPNAISTHVWVLISNLSIRTLLKPFVS